MRRLVAMIILFVFCFQPSFLALAQEIKQEIQLAQAPEQVEIPEAPPKVQAQVQVQEQIQQGQESESEEAKEARQQLARNWQEQQNKKKEIARFLDAPLEETQLMTPFLEDRSELEELYYKGWDLYQEFANVKLNKFIKKRLSFLPEPVYFRIKQINFSYNKEKAMGFSKGSYVVGFGWTFNCWGENKQEKNAKFGVEAIADKKEIQAMVGFKVKF